MDLLEHEGKDIFRRYGIKVPESRLAQTPDEALAAAAAMDYQCMVKAQVRLGGRGKAGLVRAAGDARSVAQIAAAMLGTDASPPVELLLIERRLQIEREMYLSIRIDDVLGMPVILASAHGGIDIEDHAGTISTLPVDVFDGLAVHEAVALWKRAGLDKALLQKAAALTLALWQAFRESDAQLVEINPVAVDTQGMLWAVDAKVTIDDNALVRHPQWAAARTSLPGTDLEIRARELGVNTYIDLGEGISIITSGASLGMLLLDEIDAAGGKAANFMDMGGQADGLVREKLMGLVADKAQTDRGVSAILIVFMTTSKPLKMTVDAIRGAFGKGQLPCPVFAWIGAAFVATEELSVADARGQIEALGISTFETLGETISAAAGAAPR